MPTLALVPSSFDEVLYLQANPDVRAAVEAGQFSSGAAHYQAFGYHESRNLKPAARAEVPVCPTDASMRALEVSAVPTAPKDSIPFPSPDLIFLVTNGRDPAVFEATGAADLKAVRQAVSDAGVTLRNGKLRVLDWGCGCGRLARHWASERAGVELFGCDISAELIGWCDKNLKFGKFSKCEPIPPLQYESDLFDLLYGISVFTHLTFAEHYLWMREIWRVLAPGGVAVVTAHGPTMLPVILANMKASTVDDVGTIRTTLIDEDAFVCIERAAGSNFSANALTGEMFSRICQPFDVKLHKPRHGLMGIHDTYVITKSSIGPLSFTDPLGQFNLAGRRFDGKVEMTLAGQTSFSVLAHATGLFSPATLRLSLRARTSMTPIGVSKIVGVPERVSWTLLDAAHALVKIDNLRPHHGSAELSAEVCGELPLDGVMLTLGKAMLF